MLTLFFVGIVEMIIVSTWTKLVAKARVLASGAVTMLNIFIWYYVLRIIIDDISNWHLVLIYAFGCAVGTILGTYLFKLVENKASSRMARSKQVDTLTTQSS